MIILNWSQTIAGKTYKWKICQEKNQQEFTGNNKIQVKSLYHHTPLTHIMSYYKSKNNRR